MNRARNKNWYYKVLPMAKRQLDIDEDAYREILEAFGATDKGDPPRPSASTMTVPQLEQVLSHFKSLGFRLKRPSQKPKPKSNKVNINDAQLSKITALWIELHKHGVLHQPYSDAVVSKFAYKFTRVARIQWADSFGLSKTIEALKSMARRNGVDVETE